MKSRKTVFNITIAGLFTAMITVLTAYIAHIPFGGSGGYIHFGDSFIYLAACLLPTPYAIIASALGASLADLLTAPLWIIPTIVIKALISIPFTSKSKKIINKKNVISIFFAAVVTIIGYYLAEVVIVNFNWAAPLVSIPGSIIQAIGSGLIFVAIGFSLDKVNFKNNVMRRL
ncbi:MAG TPA: TIGR04002 family protein [Clostridia bacterium]|nr:TIGR04002 family protein [Clostridia bacterium]